MKTTAAQAAALVRKELKAANIKARVTSENYAGGNSINISLTDETPETKKIADDICKKYQYGHFDGMTDCYEYSNSRKDIPQAKFVFVRNECSDALRQEIYNHIRVTWSGGDALPVNYADARNQYFSASDCYISDLVWKHFTSIYENFWNNKKTA